MTAAPALARPAPATVPARPGRARGRAVVAVLTGLLVVLAALTLTVGAYPLGDVLRVLAGHGESGAEFVLLRLRLPRLVLGAEVGVAFALAGALFQTVLRNPLASPDILGVSGGAALSAAGAILLAGWTGAAVSGAALAGAFATAAAIYVLAWRSGVSGYRFVLIGVGVAFLINAGLGYLISRADLNDVHEALVWMVGSLGTPSWQEIGLLTAALVLLLPLVGALTGRLRVLELGDDAAGGLGVPVEATRLAALAVAVALAAAGAALTGPVAFVAFVCAPIARRLVPAASLALVPSALLGAVLVLGADLLAQHVWPAVLPVGIVTGVLGAPYLLWLLATANREGRGA